MRKKKYILILMGCVLFMCVSYSAYMAKHKYYPTIALYNVYHKDYTVFRSDAVRPIQAGRALKRNFGLALENQMIGDDTGDNISLKNARLAELTAMYWVWKNVHDADYVGLMHYRRYFVLPHADETCAEENLMCYYGLTQKSLQHLFPQYDIIVPKVNRQKGMSVYQQYVLYHYREDLDMCLNYIRDKYPEMREAIRKGFIETNHGYYNNLFIMRRDIFDAYATWLFDILFALEDKLDPDLASTKTLGKYGTTKDNYQIRAEAFLAERLFTIWLYYNRPKYKVLEIPKIVLPQDRYH